MQHTGGNFIDRAYIETMLEQAKLVNDAEIDRILDKAERFEGLKHEEVAALLVNENPAHLERIFSVAGKIKDHIYGDRVVIFAPLYFSDHCINKCKYCGYRCDNKFDRRKLTMDEVREEVMHLETMGHKRLALEAGEHPLECPIEYVLEVIQTIYDMKQDNGEIRRVNVNIAATTVENYRKLQEAGIGTYILFQETYHQPTYDEMHLSGPKKDYVYHLTAFDRAMQGGIDDVGGGVLFGLADPYFEVMGLMLHNEHLENRFGVGFHTISMPRLCDAEGSEVPVANYHIDDEIFTKLVAIIRIAVPFTGMIISTRETQEMRRKLIKIGISQMSAGSSVEVGGYTMRANNAPQFVLADDRKAGDVIDWIMDENFVPSFCTACYRQGRTGDRFMQLAKSGDIKNVCLPNALMTLWEYALDYGSEDFRRKAKRVIDGQIPHIENEDVRELIVGNLQKLSDGQRDLFV